MSVHVPKLQIASDGLQGSPVETSLTLIDFLYSLASFYLFFYLMFFSFFR